MRFRVKEIVISNVKPKTKCIQKHKKNGDLCNETNELLQDDVEMKMPNACCRICLSDMYTKANPLMSPCLCTGSI